LSFVPKFVPNGRQTGDLVDRFDRFDFGRE
jgi:hypothetical protein